MTKLYNVLKASPAGDIWEMKGSQFQTFFLTLEGVEKNVMCNRKASSPIVSGPTWLDLTEAVSKKGTTYTKAKVVQAPEGQEHQTYSKPAQATLPLNMTSTSVSWGEALVAASTFVSASKELGGIPAILSVAKDLYLSPVPDARVEAEAQQVEQDNFKDEPPASIIPKDVVLTSLDPDEQIDLEAIPF